MEVYEEPNSLIGQPRPYDYSLDVKTVVNLFSTRAQSIASSSINSHIFTYRTNWLCIAPSGSLYRLIGRLPSVPSAPVDKRNADYDVFYRGSLYECGVHYFRLIQTLYSAVNELR